MTGFARLFSPLQVGPLRLPNRVVMGGMHTGLETRSDAGERLAAFYAERARGGVGLIVTGGWSPDDAGRVGEHGAALTDEADLPLHHCVTRAVRQARGHILLQILHAGAYARHAGAVAASAVVTPFSHHVPQALDEAGIQDVVAHHVRCASLAQQAGYHGVEVLGAGGYLLNGFFAPRTNRRTDAWGGTVRGRARLATTIVAGIRAAVGPDFAISFRLSLADLVNNGSRMDEVCELAQGLESAGADMLGMAIGWHESRVPTVAGLVPDAAFAPMLAELRAVVRVPLVASNRIHDPATAEAVLAAGHANLVALARPLLADAQWAEKAASGREREINPCLSCNQACLDRTFTDAVIGCIVNPRACRESLDPSPVQHPSRVVVIGAGPAGLACAATAAELGRDVTLFERQPEPGGQLRLAARIPGKASYAGTAAHFVRRLQAAGGSMVLGREPTADELRQADCVVVAAGATPRRPAFAGVDHTRVLTYEDLLCGRQQVGQRVLVVGSGALAFDVAEWLLVPPHTDRETFLREWGVAPGLPGALADQGPRGAAGTGRSVVMLHRGHGKPGQRLGASTGWARRLQLERRGLQILSPALVVDVTDAGARVSVGGQERLLDIDHVVLCTGQQCAAPADLPAELAGRSVFIGGARCSDGLDAERAVKEGWMVAHTLENET